MAATDMKVFVFGSNLAGRHGKGAALCAARKHGAVYGQGVGHWGESYAIPTKDKNLNVLHLEVIKIYVDDFILYAKDTPFYLFEVTKIGCGLAGYKEEDIKPMFSEAPFNCNLPEGWRVE